MRPLATALPISRMDLIFGGRQAEPFELVGARGSGPRRDETDRRRRTAGRGLSAALAVESCWPHTMAHRPAKPGLAPAQAEGPGLFGDRHEPRIGEDQLRKSGLQIGVGVKEVGHGFLSIMPLVPAEAGIQLRPFDWIPAYAGMSGEFGDCTDRNHATRFPLRAIAERLSASRPCAVGAAQCRHGARQRAGGCCCASRISIRPAAGRNTRRRSTKTWHGSDWPGKRRCGGNPTITTIIVPRSAVSRRWDWSIRASKAAPRSHAWSRRRRRGRRGRAIPMARRSIPAMQRSLSAADRKRRIDAGEPYALRLDMAGRACARRQTDLGRNRRRTERRDRAPSPPIPPRGET